jgi:hypothetical protein
VRATLIETEGTMSKARGIERMRWPGATLAVVGVLVGCSPKSHDEAISARRALTTSNGLAQNGLTTNGLVNNGFWANGFWANGFWANGVSGNGFWANGFWANGFWANGLTGPAAVPGNTLRSNPYARQLLQYIYSCAMPATTYDTTLDPNQSAPIPCSTADAGADAGAGCDVGYACSAAGTCVIPLQGGGANGSGLGVNADGTTWWGSGTCDETCQRWVSACVLARTNAYGVHVEISMRAPADAPQAVKDALAVSPDERAAYTLREGAYYGNIFATTPTTPPPSSGSGPATGPIASTPSYYACAGPGSNIPEVTKRFCSSQGDQSVINVPGVCLATGTEPGACLGQDDTPSSPTFGAIQDCNTSTTPAAPVVVGPGPFPQPPVQYNEVITVFLQQPIAVCGNGVCEAGEGSTTGPGHCPSDCSPGGWARNLVGDKQQGNRFAALQQDGTVVTAATYRPGQAQQVVVDDSVDPPVTIGAPPTSTAWQLALSKYSSSGVYVPGSGQLYPLDFVASGVTVAPDGSAFVPGVLVTDSGNLISPALEKFTAAGTLAGSPWPLSFGSTGTLVTQFFAVALNDADGSVVLDGTFTGTLTIGTLPPITSHGTAGGPMGDTFVTKLSAQGQPIWATNFGNTAQPNFPGRTQPTSLAVDPTGNVLLATESDSGNNHAYKLDGASGAVLWEIAQAFATRNFSILSDWNGNVYVTGVDGGGYFLASYTPDGGQRWIVHAVGPGAVGEFLANDRDGNILVAGVVNGIVDFGSGPFNAYASSYPFVAAYAPDGTFLWAKQIPVIVRPNGGSQSPIQTGYSEVMSMAVDGSGQVVLTGAFSGSIEADGYLLVNTIPEVSTNPNQFLASFSEPSLADVTPPDIGTGKAPDGSLLLTVPLDITAQATSSAGAVVFFMPPTAIDTGNSGANVACVPRPNTTFPLGTTIVTCVASDPLGNSSSATFNVTVQDRLPPQFPTVDTVTFQAANATSATVTLTDAAGATHPVTCNAPSAGQISVGGQLTGACAVGNGSVTLTVADTQGAVLLPVSTVTVQATSSDGAAVTYPTLTAMDQVDLATPVTCAPAAGSVFPIGTTEVTCTTSDKSNNQSQLAFSVTVTPPPIKVSCVGAPSAPVIVPTSPGVCGATIGNTGVAGTCTVGAGTTAPCTFDGAVSETLGPGDHAIVVVGTVGGATATCTSYVRVTDDENPVATCVSPMVECTGNGGTTVTPTAACTDNCGCATSCATAFFPVGVSAGNCVATDVSGNSATCQPLVTVVDSIPPVVTPRPGPSQVQCHVDTWTDPGATAVDACVGDVSSGVRTSGVIDPTKVGSYTETYSATDPSGHTGSASRTVNVVDTVSPTTSATIGPSTAADRTININITSYTVTPNGGGATLSGSASCWTAPGIAIALNAVDACALKQIVYALSGAQTGGATVAGGHASFTVTKAGSTTVSYYAADKAGNQEALHTIPVYVGRHPLGFGFSCAPSLSLKSFPPHGTVTAKGTVTITSGKQTITQSFSFTQSY